MCKKPFKSTKPTESFDFFFPVLYVKKLNLSLLRNQTDWEPVWFGSQAALTDVNQTKLLNVHFKKMFE